MIPGAVESHGKSEADSVDQIQVDKAHEALGISWDILGYLGILCVILCHVHPLPLFANRFSFQTYDAE